mgnify:CR=1 FL=1
MNTKLRILFASAAALTLSGCGGGGGSSSSLTQITFSDWNSITKPSQVNLEGISTDVSYSTDAGITKITSVTNHGVDSTAAASVDYRTDSTISKISFATNNGTVTFDENGTDTIGDTGNVVYGYDAAGTKFVIASDPLYSGNNWNYQTFGIWETGRGTGSGTAGAVSVGAATAGSSIPTSGSATYSGHFGGTSSDANGVDVITTGGATVVADFANRSLAFSTTGSKYVSPVASSPSWINKSSLDMTGTLTYSAATNSFSGAVSDSFIGSGTATGKFYGPSAEEIGGVFSLTGAGTLVHAGGFGAKK